MEISKTVEKVFADQAQQDLIQDLCQQIEILKAKLADAREALNEIIEEDEMYSKELARECLERINK